LTGNRCEGSTSGNIPHSYGANFSGVAFLGDNKYEAPSEASANPTATTNITKTGNQSVMFPPYL